MARPTKAASLLTPKSQTKAEIAARKESENALKGTKKPPTPPKWLSDNQRKIFRLIVNELKAADILCKLDTWILQECVLAIDALETIEKRINGNPELLFDKDTLSAKDKYTKIFFRCCNELSLSPQSRAKIANINTQAGDESITLIKQIIAGGVDSNGI